MRVPREPLAGGLTHKRMRSLLPLTLKSIWRDEVGGDVGGHGCSNRTFPRWSGNPSFPPWDRSAADRR